MRAAVGCGIAFAVLSLTGCSHSSAEESQVLPTLSAPASAASPSASSTASLEPAAPPAASAPSPAVVVVPAAARAATPEGAAAFARFFYAQITRGFQLRNPALVSDLSLKTCKTCKLYVDSITAVRDMGQRVEGGTFYLTFAVSPQVNNSQAARVDVGWIFNGAVFYGADGAVAERHSRQQQEEQVALVRVDGSWRVATVKRVVHK